MSPSSSGPSSYLPNDIQWYFRSPMQIVDFFLFFPEDLPGICVCVIRDPLDKHTDLLESSWVPWSKIAQVTIVTVVLSCWRRVPECAKPNSQSEARALLSTVSPQPRVPSRACAWLMGGNGVSLHGTPRAAQQK